MEIKMFKMGVGESILLSEKDSCLLVELQAVILWYKVNYFLWLENRGV